ncbi:MAG TPA: ABC transporter ATP-binding protein, partial [Nordella sp.]|nr:ABC transporter ATP-binding protein [Nordella sp.]
MAEHGSGLVLDGVSKHYGGVAALQPISIEIKPGEFFSLIGPSGSGKSTLLGAIAGFIPPSAGRILIDGRDIVDIPPYRRNIGMVFQNYALFPHLTVFENVAFALRLRKLSKAEVTGKTQRMLDIIRLSGMGERRISELSGGQQQRVALARAAVYDPRILLMDEPLGALDKNLREEMQYEIKAFHNKIAATIVYVTHDQEEAAAMSDRIAIMRDGQIVQHGGPRDLYEHPRNIFVASFLGDANIFKIRDVKAEARSLRLDIGDGLSVSAPGDTASASQHYVCVRPESIAIGAPGVFNGAAGQNVLSGTIADVVYTA